MSFQGELASGQETTTNAYAGHVFVFTDKQTNKKERKKKSRIGE